MICIAGGAASVNPTDLSLASHQFLAKYGLEIKNSNPADSKPNPRPLTSERGSGPPAASIQPPPPAPSPATQPQFERLLDITAIKQQSKLL